MGHHVYAQQFLTVPANKKRIS